MKYAIGIGIIAFSTLLAGCGHNNNDVQIRQKIVGTWKLDSDPTNSITFNSDGTCSSTGDSGPATWALANGVFTLAESGPNGETDTVQVVSIDDHTCVLKDVSDGEGEGDITKLDKQ